MDPDRVEAIENSRNSEKQISSLLNYLKFLTSESLSFKKKKSKVPPEINLNVKNLAHLEKLTLIHSGLKEEIINEANCKHKLPKNNPCFTLGYTIYFMQC